MPTVMFTIKHGYILVNCYGLANVSHVVQEFEPNGRYISKSR